MNYIKGIFGIKKQNDEPESRKETIDDYYQEENKRLDALSN